MTVAGIATSPLSELEHRVQLRRAVIASTIGTIEWYDFFLYSTVTGPTMVPFPRRLPHTIRSYEPSR
jgi:hypothetical protein